VEAEDDPAVLRSFGNALPKQTLVLRELAALVQERIVAALPEHAEQEPGLQPILASAYVDLTSRLSDLGQREPALAAEPVRNSV
jgi:hypothetical protein